eukprot:7768585-Pyramimonas_sp.AAC.1
MSRAAWIPAALQGPEAGREHRAWQACSPRDPIGPLPEAAPPGSAWSPASFRTAFARCQGEPRQELPNPDTVAS